MASSVSPRPGVLVCAEARDDRGRRKTELARARTVGQNEKARARSRPESAMVRHSEPTMVTERTMLRSGWPCGGGAPESPRPGTSPGRQLLNRFDGGAP